MDNYIFTNMEIRNPNLTVIYIIIDCQPLPPSPKRDNSPSQEIYSRFMLCFEKKKEREKLKEFVDAF